jgi:hypothetical protein
LVEPAEPDASRQVTDDREAQLGHPHEPVEQLAGRGVGGGRGRGLGEPTLEDGCGHRHLGRRPLLGEEDAEDSSLEARRSVEVGDAVVLEHALEPADEVRGQATPLRVEGLEVGVEVLARAVHPVLDVSLLPQRPVAAQLREVGEDPEQVHLVADR